LSPQKIKQSKSDERWNRMYEEFEKEKDVGNMYPTEALVRFISMQRQNITKEDYYNDKGNEFSLRNNFSGNALEVGFGTVANLRMLKNKGYNVTGLEVSQEAVDRGIASLKKSNDSDINLSHWTPIELKYDDNQFDLVVGMQCVYYNLDLEGFIKEVYRVLKPGGIFIFSFFSDRSDYLKYIDIVDGDLVKWSDNHPNKRLPDIHFRQPQSKKTLINLFSNFSNVDVFTEESDFSPVFHSWWYVHGQKVV